MHLLRRVKGDHPQLVWFPDKPPKYAILSHRWVDDEPTFQDFVRDEASRRDGFKKIIFCERQAAKDEIDYFWVDTVCINKESSAELNEALNSMFRWYKESAKCYVFMPDVTSVEEDFRQSCWFERGWTLQELIAPPVLEFYNKDEMFLGTKASLEGQVSAITGVPGSALRGEALSKFSIPERLTWVKNRITTREEDKAYCLLGIFGIHMPVIYGEKENAFIRLMEEIERRLTGLHNLQTFSSIRQKLYNNSGDIMSPIDCKYTPPTTPPMTPPLNDTPRSDDEYLGIKHALFASDVQTRHEQIKSFDSSQWLFDHPTFQSWTKGDRIEDKILTLRGNPGTGKSVLIKEASKRVEDQKVLVLRHYFNRSQHGKTKQLTSPLEEFYTSLLYQVLDSLEPRPWGFIKKWTEILRHRPGEKPWGLPQLQDAISEIVTTQNFKIAKVRIFIDALEESCDDEGGIGASQPLDILSFASRLLKMATNAAVDLKICISRQHLPTFGELEPKTLSIIVEDHNRPALEAFVSEELRRVEHPVLRPLLYQKIVSRCTNDFLWTTAVIEDVLANTKSSKEKDVFNAIDELPRTHKEMYQRILQNEMPAKQKDTVPLLQIVSGARRPITVNEFRHALAFITDFTYDDIEQWERSDDGFLAGELFENYIRRESLGLIEIHDATEANDFIRFIHGSVDIFLRDPSSILPSGASPWAECSHLTLFSMCLRALNFSSLRKEEPIAFVKYASEHWLYHGRDAGVRINEIAELPDFLTNCSKRKTKRIIEKQIVALKQSQDRASNLIEDDEPLLVLLASTGCTDMLERHLAGCLACQEACSTYDPSYRKALSNALIGRWTNTALLLFQKHGDGDAGINNLFESRTLLYRACYFDQTEVVAFLLERGADPLVHSPWGYEYPLHVTIALAREKTMNLLLQHGKVEEQFKLQRKEASCRGCTALHMALRGRQPHRTKIAVLKWLLKKAPKRIGILEIRDEEDVSVLDLARQMKTDGLPGAEDLDDEIQDFFDQYER